MSFLDAALVAAVEAELPFLRAQAEGRMGDTFAIKRSLGIHFNGTDDVETFEDLFTTVGRVKVSGGLGVNDSQAGDRTVTTVTRELHIPVDSPAVPAGAVAFVETLGALTDPSLAGARLRLSGPAPGSQTTARRMTVTEVLT